MKRIKINSNIHCRILLGKIIIFITLIKIKVYGKNSLVNYIKVIFKVTENCNQ